MKKNNFIIFFTFLIFPCTLNAIPARPGRLIETQPDGSEIIVYKHGDEVLHWITNENGARLERDSLGYLRVVPNFSKEEISRRIKNSRFFKNSPSLGVVQTVEKRTPPRSLVILVNFKDYNFATSKETLDSMYNVSTFHRSYSYYNRIDKDTVYVDAIGSVRKYFTDVSMGAYEPIFDVVGPYTLSQNRKYYGENDYFGNDKNPEEMIKEACELAQANANVDFSLYDSDNDGDIDVVNVVYASYGEADAPSIYENTIWPHSYTFDEDYYNTHSVVKFNGKRLNRYACFNEINYVSKKHDGIGTFCHEFSHVLGLPDFYVTSTSSTEWKTPGEWDLMDHGSYNNDGNTPPSYSGYERFFMGWGTPQVILDTPLLEIPEIQATNNFFLICGNRSHNLIGNGPSPSTFYILENRQQKGWDEHLPGHGLLLTWVDYSYSKWENNVVNNIPSSPGLDIIEADGNTSPLSQGKATDLFPAGATSYKSTNRKGVDISFNNVQERNGIISLSSLVVSTLTDVTPITTNKTNLNCYKSVVNGEIIIFKNGHRYDILGNELSR